MADQTPGTTPPRLEMRGIGKSFGGVAVLSDVELAVAPGEVMALLGSNGAGKSTLVKILTGVYTRDAGTVKVDGEPVVFADPRAAVAAGVRLLPQEISVMGDMTVAENISLADLPTRAGPGFPMVDDRAMNKQSRALLDQLGFASIDVNALVKRLSVAEQRIVEIARALAGQARVLVMDEPTAALTEQEAKLIFRIIQSLKEQQVAVIYISHYLNEVFEISDRIAVLRDGRNAGLFTTAAASRGEVLAAMLGRVADDLYDFAGGGNAGEEVLTTSGLSVPGKLDTIDMAVRSGEIVGVFGLIGSGIETLGRAVYGALGPATRGTILMTGTAYRPESAGRGKARGIGFVAADRKQEGIIGDLTVRENMVAPFQDRYVQGLFVSRSAETEQAKRWIDLLGIRTRGPEQTMRTLSGGNQQKVCVSRWLVDSVKLLILEEPTRGVDVGARREIYMELRALADRGLAVLVLSSDVEEVAGISDRSLVLDRGRIVGRFDKGALPAELMAATTNDPAFNAA
ncbi:MAG: sugar ABC transporter ATP-binding protein [Bauldia sp.]|uniref:sugar ABC transporter ATP-binding protein n=1 Tax=Bauldia sp. TaxID=2575872 RepID=UPI001D291374|nr:sugar ABC transporter ATP-binding protein [Bauldia sp.]MCB1495077.1 sugar ABC transporter ATP-binding protein [Bauldia sp.]